MEKTIRPKIEGVELTGSQSEWDKLPGRIRTLVKNSGLARLSRVRNLIATDAGLPMPKIYVVPCCWVLPKDYGLVNGMMQLTPVGQSNEKFVFSALISAATIIIIEDNELLRRIVCHEFAHCFWWTCQTLLKSNLCESEAYINRLPSKTISIEERLKRDSEELIDPKAWFGQWDVDHFIFGEDNLLNHSTERRAISLIGLGLPVVEPNLQFSFEGKLCIEDEIYEHVRMLEKKLKE